jgi:hypothetical protein
MHEFDRSTWKMARQAGALDKKVFLNRILYLIDGVTGNARMIVTLCQYEFFRKKM